jgi:hypothetical protein
LHGSARFLASPWVSADRGSRLPWSAASSRNHPVEVLQRCRSGHRNAQADVDGAAGEVALLEPRRHVTDPCANRGIVDPPALTDRLLRPSARNDHISACKLAPSMVQTTTDDRPGADQWALEVPAPFCHRLRHRQ